MDKSLSLSFLTHGTVASNIRFMREVLVSSFDISDRTGLLSYKWHGGSVTEAPELNADIEEADLRTVLHALYATKMDQKGW